MVTELMKFLRIVFLMIMVFSSSLIVNANEKYDVVIINGLTIDGSGYAPKKADVGIRGTKIVKIGNLGNFTTTKTIDAHGKYVTPGFINVLSWAPVSLLQDGRGMSDLLQGVTLEIFGEGVSLGPVTKKLRKDITDLLGGGFENGSWNTLGEFLEFLVKKGVSPNVASFVGATTIRLHVLGEEDRAPSAQELLQMQNLVRESMKEGALGLGSSLIYPPAFFAKTDELIALAKVASEYGGSYISHMRSEGAKIEQALDELIQIAREANLHAEIYHLKFAGKENWKKFDTVIEKIHAARRSGINITADIYPYIAGGTGLTATIPPWAQDGGFEELIKRLKDPEQRKLIISNMREHTDKWENFFSSVGPDNIILVGNKNPIHGRYIGKSISEIAAINETTPAELIVDMLIADNSEMEAIYFLMDEANIARKMKLPWVSFGSDAEALNPVGKTLEKSEHPRAYGTFARILGKYVRDEKVISIEEAIRKLTSLPADNFNIKHRGRLQENYYADIAIFDLAKIQEKATFSDPHHLSVGMSEVLVNGEIVIENGVHTGKTPGQVVRGPGWKK